MSDCPGPGCTDPSHERGNPRRVAYMLPPAHGKTLAPLAEELPTASTEFRPPPSARPVPPWTDPQAFDGWEAEVGRMVDRAAHLDAQADAAGGAIASAARKMANRLRAKALLLSREAQAVTGRKAP